MADKTSKFPAVVLLHGIGGAARIWARQMATFAAAGLVPVALDLPGYGARPPVTSLDFEGLAGDVEAAIDKSGLERPVLLGHSMGGMVAQTAVLRAPHRFDGLVLMDTSHRGLRADTGLVEVGVAIARAEGLAAVMAAQDALGAEGDSLGTPAHERLLATREGYREFMQRKMLVSSAAMYVAMLTAITAEGGVDRLADLEAVDLPTLVIVGDQDAPFLKPSRRMADAIPGAELVVVPDAGHSPQFESPDHWWDALRGFLTRL
jgi:pimeloyl-ACP methyl ester carboxylesterase